MGLVTPMTVHNHGPDDGPGTACREATDALGRWRGACMPPPTPVELFSKLVREVDAGRTLVEQTERSSRQLAALDALDLARDVLTDARDLFGSCACGAVELVPADDDAPCCIAQVTSAGRDHVPGCDERELAHAAAVCVRINAKGAQL